MRAQRSGAGLLAAAVLLLLLIPAALPAEVSSSVTIRGYTSLLYSGDADDPLAAAAILQGSLYLDSVGNSNVRGYLQVDSWIGESLALDVPRAYVKVRFPGFRLTFGKTRVSWGDGLLFNAGDVLFGSMDLISQSLSDDTLRPETGWLTAVYLPLGAFSFLEVIAAPYDLPAEPGILAGDLETILGPLSFHSLSGGARGVFKMERLNTTLEAGYFASGAEAEHRPYLSLHGHLLVDWNFSAALNIPMFQTRWSEWEQWLDVSAGLFHLVNLGLNRTLSLRLEAAVRPGAVWNDEDLGSRYRVFLFPEIAYAPSDTVSLQLRSLLSPGDLSALILTGIDWNVYQGLDLFAFLSFMAGERDRDLFHPDQLAGAGLTVGLEFIY